jgi:hypothetical protein
MYSYCYLDSINKFIYRKIYFFVKLHQEENMNYDTKPVQINKEVHSKLKEASKKTGIKIKDLTETAIMAYLNRLKYGENE